MLIHSCLNWDHNGFFFTVPDAIQNLRCDVSSWQSIIVEWDPPSNTDGILTYYIHASGNNVQNILPKDHTYTFTELQSNTSYQFSITAVNSLGQGESKNCTLTTLAEAGMQFCHI